MRDSPSSAAHLEARLAKELEALRAARGWSLEALAERTGISRASLSRLERGETSPTAAMLGRLCAAYGWTLSRLMALAEAEPRPLLRAGEQLLWIDPETGFRRRTVSPPSTGYRAELIDGVLPPGAVIAYPDPPISGLEHHLLMLSGMLDIEIAGISYRLEAGDCLRYRLTGASRFATPGPAPAHYLIALVQP
jgi:transcriptional regulator with XRE-family HTH domain